MFILSNAIISGTQIDAVQACYVIGKLPLVKKTREVISVNTMKDISYSLITEKEMIENLNEDEDASNITPASQLGKRLAYEKFIIKQIEQYPNQKYIDFYTFLSCFRTGKYKETTESTEKKKSKLLEIPLFDFDSKEHIIKNGKSFVIDEIYFTIRKIPAVVSLNPYFPVNENKEESAYSILLLHSQLDKDGFKNILRESNTAIQRLKILKEEKKLPDWVLISLKRRKHSDNMQDNVGQPILNGINSFSEEEFESEEEYLRDKIEESNLRQENKYKDIEGEEITTINESKILTSTPIKNMAYLTNYIERKIAFYELSKNSFYSLTEDDISNKTITSKVKIGNEEILQKELDERLQIMNEMQLKAYDAFINCSVNNTQQCIEFISGEGGTGKSEVTKAIIAKLRIHYGKVEGRFGSVIVGGPTGNSAYNIGGSTWHSIFGKSSQGRITSKSTITNERLLKLQTDGLGSKILVLEEISLISLEDFYEINKLCQIMKNCYDKPFGGLHVLLLGDLYQMKTLKFNGKSIVETNSNIHNTIERREAQKIFTEYLTHFFELTENCRAKSNNGVLSPLAKFNKAARLNALNDELLLLVNTRVVNDIDDALNKAHEKSFWITSTHNKIKEINEYIKDYRLSRGHQYNRIICQHISASKGTPFPDERTNDILYGIQGCAKGERYKPFLTHIDLSVGSRVRVIRNMWVEGGLFNGAMGTVYGFVYEGSGPNKNNICKRFSKIEEKEKEIPIVLVQMDDESIPYTCIKGIPRLVPFTAIPGANVKESYCRLQIPLLVAHARTAHSVQGLTAKEGVVLDPTSSFFAGNYIGTSRATELSKLFLLKPLNEKNFSFEPEHRNNVDNFYKNLRRRFPS